MLLLLARGEETFMSYFQARQLTFSYDKGRGTVLDGFSMSVEQGEVVGIVGPSGGGKSTLLRIIAGLEMPRAGSIVMDGETLVDEQRFVLPERRSIGMIFQDYALFPHLTVAQNIQFGLPRTARKERRARLDEMLELIQMESYTRAYPHELSGGQQQRVAFARALAPRPRLLLMDEPFSSLDAELKSGIRSELKRMLHASGMTCMLVSHDREDTDAICDRVVSIR